MIIPVYLIYHNCKLCLKKWKETLVNEFKSTQPVDVNFLIAFFMFAFCIFLDKVIVIKVYI